MNKQTVLVIVIAALLVGGMLFLGDSSQKTTDKNIDTDAPVSRQGVHWHPELTIVINGEKQVVPPNIGIGMQYSEHPQYDHMMRMTNMHTHDNSGTLHWEVMRGPVRKEDVRLGQFFSVWGKQFTRSCVFDFCNGPEGMLRMVVNGAENIEFEDYIVGDKDIIEIRYE